MTKAEKDEWQKRKDAEDAGFDPKPWRGLIIHSQNTSKHEFVKFAIAYVLDEMGREWDTETQMQDGRVDVFDFGPVDGQALVYEVETSVTDARKRAKVDQYCKGPVRDVLVIDPADVPSELESALDYVRSHIIIG